MNIYHLDATILKSSEYRDKWQERDFYDCVAHLKKHLAYSPDWEEGENWCRFYLNDKFSWHALYQDSVHDIQFRRSP